jgi:lactoylglutathione lyase
MITEGPVHFPGGTSIFVRDPDRNVVEFHQPSEASIGPA